MFKAQNNITLSRLKDQLTKINCWHKHRHTRRVDGVE